MNRVVCGIEIKDLPFGSFVEKDYELLQQYLMNHNSRLAVHLVLKAVQGRWSGKITVVFNRSLKSQAAMQDVVAA